MACIDWSLSDDQKLLMLVRQHGYNWVKIVSNLPGRSVVDVVSHVEVVRRRVLEKAGKLPDYLKAPVVEKTDDLQSRRRERHANKDFISTIPRLGLNCPACKKFLNCSHLMNIGLSCCGVESVLIAESLCRVYDWWTLIRLRDGDTRSLSCATIIGFDTVVGCAPSDVRKTDRACIVLGETEIRRIFRAADPQNRTMSSRYFTIGMDWDKLDVKRVARLNGRDKHFEYVNVNSLLPPSLELDNAAHFLSAGITFCGIGKKFSLWPTTCMDISHQRGQLCKCSRLCSAQMILNKLVREIDGGKRPIHYPLEEGRVKKRYRIPWENTRASRAKTFRKVLLKHITEKPVSLSQVGTLSHLKSVLKRDRVTKTTTQQSYGARLDTIFADRELNVLHYLWSPKTVLAHWLEKKGYRLSTVQTYITLIKVLLRNMTDWELAELVKPFPVAKILHIYSTILFKLLRGSTSQRNKQRPSARENANWLDVQDIEMLMQKLRVTETLDGRQWCLYLHLMQWMTLRNDYRTVTYNINDPNHINVSNGIFILTKFKSDKFCKEVKKPLPPDLLRLVVEMRNDRGGGAYDGHLFLDSNGRPFTTNAFSKYMMRPFKQEFGKNVGSQMLRKIWATEQQKNEPTIREEQRRAGNMLHSVHQHKQYRRL
jgi:Myb-like DNA-binding protein